jgi:aminopeptidase 2
MIGSIVAYCTSGLTKQEQLDAVTAFFKDKPSQGFDRALAQATDSIKAKIQWTKRDTGDLRQWLGMD